MINSVRTGVMAQFKNSFVAATPSNQDYPNKRPALTGFVSGGTIGGDMGRTQTPPVITGHNSSHRGLFPFSCSTVFLVRFDLSSLVLADIV